MKNRKDIKIEDIFDLNEQLFNSLSWNQNGTKGFGTGWMINSLPSNFGIDLLELNGNKNKYIEFIEKNFYKPLEFVFNSKSLGRQLVPYLYLEETVDVEMKLTFNSFNVFGSLYSSSLIADLGPSFDDLVKSFSNLNEMFEYLKNIFKEERKLLKTTDVNILKNNEKNYVVYTDNSYDNNNKLRIYASIYNPDNLQFIGNPDTKEEWDIIYNLLDKTLLN